MSKEKYDKNISIRLTSKMLEDIDKASDELQVDRTEFIRFAIGSFLSRDNRLDEIEKMLRPASNAIRHQARELKVIYTDQKTSFNLNEIAAKATEKPSKI